MPERPAANREAINQIEFAGQLDATHETISHSSTPTGRASPPSASILKPSTRA
jgi:hypothetical protein